MPAERTLRRAPRELSEVFASATLGARGPALPRANGLANGLAIGGERERARRRFVSAVVLVYLLAIFEGSIRKYVAPQFGQYIFFVRDPVVIYAYLLCTRHALWPRQSPMFVASVALALLGLVWFVLQSALGGYSETRLLLGVYGWRSYFLYAPLAFAIGAQLQREDLLRIARITLWLTLPIAVLVVAQFFSPIGAPINVGIAAEKEFQFAGLGLDAERVRASGPFTSGVGLQQFVATALAFVLAFAIRPAARSVLGPLMLLVFAGATLTSVALSGSRGTLLQCVLIGAGAIAYGLVGRGAGAKARALAVPLALAGLAVVLYPVVFPEGFESFSTRWTSAAAVESGFQGGVLGRALYGFVDFLRLFGDVPVLGYGLGYGGNASILMHAKVDGVEPGLLAETDFARHMVDLGPVFGLGYIAFRAVLAVWLAKAVLGATRRAADPLPMMLFAYAGYVLVLGQLTGHGSINVYGWLFTGLCLAACQPARPRDVTQLVPALPRGAASTS